MSIAFLLDLILELIEVLTILKYKTEKNFGIIKLFKVLYHQFYSVDLYIKFLDFNHSYALRKTSTGTHKS